MYKMMFILVMLILNLFSINVLANTQFESLGVEQGLSQSTVICMLEDRQGFLWIGTQEGLNRYDGYDVKTYYHEPENPHSLSNDYIMSLFEDEHGSIWIGTHDGGLNKYDPKTDKFESFQHDINNPQSISSNNVHSILAANKDQLIIATADAGIDIFSTKKTVRLLTLLIMPMILKA